LAEAGEEKVNDHSDSPFLISKKAKFTPGEYAEQKRDENLAALAGAAAGGVGGYKSVKAANRVKNASDLGGTFYRVSRDAKQSRASSAALAAKTTAVAAAKAPKTGPTLGALGAGYVGLIGGTALAGSAARKRRAKKQLLSKNLTQAQIDRRKKLQAATSITTATLGLGALGALGAKTAVRPAARAAVKAGRLRPVNDKKIDNFEAKADSVRNTALTVGAGVGGLGGYNFASYTRAEAKQRKKNIKQ
jgi:hypothetical protein